MADVDVRVTGVSAEEWLSYMSQPFQPGMMLQAASGSIMAPAKADAIGNYAQKAAAAASPGTAPGSVFEGMQTIANLARVRASYNPLDPEGTGNKAHFLQFTQYIADAPMLTLLKADTIEVNERSRNSDMLIKAFVGAFVGLATEDVNEIQGRVKSLAQAALSYSNRQERYSNFAQNLLQTNSSGAVEFHLYSSQFQISQTERKGTITFASSYHVLRAVYQLSPNGWSQVREIFNQQQKTSTQSWLDNMNTKPKPGGGARALCLI
jgi:hypothetical protein